MNAPLQLAMVLATIALFLLSLAINELVFRNLEFLPGINWVYLPAGIRLLSTLLFAEAGAVGLLIVSWLVSFLYFFPGDFVRAFAGGILATIAPYGVYLFAKRYLHIRSSLANLTAAKLLVCAFLYAVASPLLHHIWFFLHGDNVPILPGFFVMFVGDFLGSLIVIYGLKGALAFLPRDNNRPA